MKWKRWKCRQAMFYEVKCNLNNVVVHNVCAVKCIGLEYTSCANTGGLMHWGRQSLTTASVCTENVRYKRNAMRKKLRKTEIQWKRNMTKMTIKCSLQLICWNWYVVGICSSGEVRLHCASVARLLGTISTWSNVTVLFVVLAEISSIIIIWFRVCL